MNGIIFIGLQASGKSSFYQQQFSTTHIRLNMDMLKTRHRENILFQACLNSKQPVVIDNTNPTVAQREAYIEGFKEHKFNITGYYFEANLSKCLERNAARQGKDKIPEIGIKGVYKKLELPTYGEGFDCLYYVSLTGDGFNVSEWKSEI
ncbi:ATP-binding protein [Sessilibacter corallicola]|uniref:Kinase n=1 Tax=Sessilibacter corallicola TaxID=2904075 RepID=A0ABQ0AD15_9GAMM